MMKYNTAVYNGEWKKDMREGLGVISNEFFFFEGYFKSDSTIGEGILIHKQAINDGSGAPSLQLKSLFEDLTLLPSA